MFTLWEDLAKIGVGVFPREKAGFERTSLFKLGDCNHEITILRFRLE